MTITHLAVFLGNPGERYDATRHNAGFMCADYIARRETIDIKKLKFRSLCAEMTLGGARVLLLKPQTLMNASGLAVHEAAEFYKIPSDKIVVICDDVTQDPGKIRIRAKGSDGGHNGLKSIINMLGTQDFPRIRVGVGARPHTEYDLADWVLSKIPPSDMPKVNEAVEKAADALSMIIAGNLEAAQAKYN